MRFSLERFTELLEKRTLSQEETVEFNILNFIHVIILNGFDFIESSYNSEYFGDIPMKFMKNAGQVSGIITADIDTGKQIYVFNDRGFDSMESLMSLDKGPKVY